MANYWIISLLLITSCMVGQQQNSLFIDFNNVDSLKISYIKNNQQKPIVVTNPEEIREIGERINANHKEPIKFLPQYKIELIRKGETDLLLCTDGVIKHKGISYRLEKDIKNIIEKYTKQESIKQ